jgi:hypothetical protein
MVGEARGHVQKTVILYSLQCSLLSGLMNPGKNQSIWPWFKKTTASEFCNAYWLLISLSPTSMI